MSFGEIEYSYQHIFDKSGIATAFVAPGDSPGEGRFIHVNAAMCELLGYTETELCTLTVDDITHPDDRRPNTELRVDMAERGLSDFQLEKRFVHKSGRTVWIYLSVIAVRDEEGRYLYDIGQHQDITDLKQAEERLRESEQRFRHYAEASADWFWEMDASLRVTYISESIRRLAGAPPQWHYGKSRRELLGGEYDHNVWDAHLATLDAHLPFRNFEYLRVGDDTVRPAWIRTSGIPIFDDDGTFAGYRGSASDITEFKQIEMQLRHAHKMEAIGQLTGGVAHDFNNLLAVIVGNAELLGDTLGENAKLDAIIQAATRGSELIQHMLAFSRQQTLTPQKIDLQQLIGELVEMFQRTLGEQIKMKTDVPEDAWHVRADPGQLENALLNLAINARDAMAGRGTLEIRCGNVVLRDGDLRVGDEIKAGDYLRIAVRDTGSGMPAEVIEHAFDPFFTTKDFGKGSGLGLSMVYGFVRQSGGDVVIDSALGKGTEISLYLPRAHDGAAAQAPATNGASPVAEGATVLVVEDDDDLRTYTTATLEKLGYRVIGAADADAALQALAGMREPIDLLLCDIVLPGNMSGPQLADAARDIWPDVKLVFMSGYGAQLYDDSHVPGFETKLLAKPFRYDELAEAVRGAVAP